MNSDLMCVIQSSDTRKKTESKRERESMWQHTAPNNTISSNNILNAEYIPHTLHPQSMSNNNANEMARTKLKYGYDEFKYI